MIIITHTKKDHMKMSKNLLWFLSFIFISYSSIFKISRPANNMKNMPPSLSVVQTTRSSCISNLDCSLNGICFNSSCICNSPWIGVSCSLLDELPVHFPQGYGQTPNLTSWGGSVLTDPTTGIHHAFISIMTNGFPLSTWYTNSRIDHATSSSITGPYVFSSVAVNTWAHNAAPLALADGTFAIFHVGLGAGPPDGGIKCSKLIPPRAPSNGGTVLDQCWPPYGGKYWSKQVSLLAPRCKSQTEGSTIHISRSLEGPWIPLMNNSLGDCNNPSPWLHKNGTFYITCNQGDYHVLKSAETISGPWREVSKIKPSRPKFTMYEGAFLWIDQNDNWHILLHAYNIKEDRTQCVNSTVSRHLYSRDGFKWHLGALQPYSTQVKLVTPDGVSTVTVSTRERPKILFSPFGSMTHLMTTACSAPACPEGPSTGCVDCKYKYWDYTLITPLAI